MSVLCLNLVYNNVQLLFYSGRRVLYVDSISVHSDNSRTDRYCLKYSLSAQYTLLTILRQLGDIVNR